MSKYLFDTKENDPQEYYWFNEALNAQEVGKVIGLASELPAEKASVIGEEGGGATRSSMVKWIPRNNPDWDWLYERMMDLATEANDALWHFDLRTSLEAIQYTEYYASEKGHYDWHQDIGIGKFPSKRKVSITIQLSADNEYVGGELQICSGSDGSGLLNATRTCQRGTGVGVLFPSYMMHRVSPVTNGTRRSLVLWVGGEHYR